MEKTGREIERSRSGGCVAARSRPIEQTSPVSFPTPPPTTPQQARMQKRVIPVTVDDMLPAALAALERTTSPPTGRTPTCESRPAEPSPVTDDLSMDQFDRMLKGRANQTQSRDEHGGTPIPRNVVRAIASNDVRRIQLMQEINKVFAEAVARGPERSKSGTPASGDPATESILKIARSVVGRDVSPLQPAATAVAPDRVVDSELPSFSKRIHFDASAQPQNFTSNSNNSRCVCRPKPCDAKSMSRLADELHKRSKPTSKRPTRSERSAFSETNTEESSITSLTYSGKSKHSAYIPRQ